MPSRAKMKIRPSFDLTPSQKMNPKLKVPNNFKFLISVFSLLFIQLFIYFLEEIIQNPSENPKFEPFESINKCNPSFMHAFNNGKLIQILINLYRGSEIRIINK